MTIRRMARTSALRARADSGFTLIELLIVVIVIGLLAAIAVPVYLGAQQHARESAVVSDVANLRTAVITQDLANSAMPVGLPSTTTSLTAPWKAAGATLGTFTTNVVYKPGSGTSFCVAGLSATGTVFIGSDGKGISQSAQTTLDAACP